MPTFSLNFQELLSADSWNKLILQFRQENFKLHQLNSTSVFTATLQAGLSALKTLYLLLLSIFLKICIFLCVWPDSVFLHFEQNHTWCVSAHTRHERVKGKKICDPVAIISWTILKNFLASLFTCLRKSDGDWPDIAHITQCVIEWVVYTNTVSSTICPMHLRHREGPWLVHEAGYFPDRHYLTCACAQ